MPDRFTVCAAPLTPPELSVTASDAEREPGAVGVKVTLIEQVLPAARLVPQVLVWAKSAGFVPLSAMPEMSNVALPVLESVTASGPLVVPTFWLPNALAVERLALGSPGGGGEVDPPPPQADQIPTPSNIVANTAPLRAA